MRTVVDDAIHVEVKTVKLRDAVFGDQLRDSRVSLAEPSKEFGNTNGGGGCRTKGGMLLSG